MPPGTTMNAPKDQMPGHPSFRRYVGLQAVVGGGLLTRVQPARIPSM